MRRPIVFKLMLLLAGSAAGLALLEGAVRLVTHPVHEPGMYVEDPDVGYVLAPGFEGELSRPEFRVAVTTSDAGLRGAAPRPRREDTFRILVLGDSQAWGFGVADGETFSAELERLLSDRHPTRDVQVLNGGVPGYGTADQLALLGKRGPELEPDLVVVQFLSVNDFKENRAPASTWATVKDGMLGHRAGAADPGESYDYPAWIRAKQWIKRKSRAAQLAIDGAGYLALRFGLVEPAGSLWGEDFTDEDARLATELLVEIARTAEGLGAETLLLYSTGQAHVIRDDVEPPRSARVVERAAEAAGVPWIDATSRLRAREDRLDLYFRENGHWTAAGHRAIAQILAESIDAAGLLRETRGAGA